MLILPPLYWCVNAGLGIRIGVILSASHSVNTFFKFVFHEPRPYWVSDKVRVIHGESSYGMPSGHAQHGIAVWGTMAFSWAKGWGRGLMTLLIFLIGCSRIVLGVHFPTDVLAGWLIGAAILWAFLRWEMPVMAWFNRFTLGQKINLAFAASMLLIVISLAGLVFVPTADPPEWNTTAARVLSLAPSELALNPRTTTGTVGVAGTFFGLAAGAILMFHRGGFDVRGIWWKRVVRFVLGAIGVTVLWLGLRMLFPRDASLGSQVLRYLRCGLTGFWVSYGAPWVFIKLRLQSAAASKDFGPISG